MTHQEREQYFAQYWGQKVLNTILKEGDYELVNVEFYEWDYKDGDHLLLTDIKNISNEDAMVVADMVYAKMGGMKPRNDGEKFDICLIGKRYLETHDIFAYTIYQYLQSKGYALPFRQYSVQDLI